MIKILIFSIAIVPYLSQTNFVVLLSSIRHCLKACYSAFLIYAKTCHLHTSLSGPLVDTEGQVRSQREAGRPLLSISMNESPPPPPGNFNRLVEGFNLFLPSLKHNKIVTGQQEARGQQNSRVGRLTS